MTQASRRVPRPRADVCPHARGQLFGRDRSFFLLVFDSLLEQRFAKDFRRVAPDWDVIREPRPITSQSSIIFPDFELVHRHEPSRRLLLEIVGFWTPK